MLISSKLNINVHNEKCTSRLLSSENNNSTKQESLANASR